VAGTAWQGTQWIIDEGVRPGDKVIVDGAQKIVPDAPVRPVAYHPESDSTLAVGRDTTVVAPPSAAPPIQPTIEPRERR
jgi:membrane fusion protein, multidrug efflux system